MAKYPLCEALGVEVHELIKDTEMREMFVGQYTLKTPKPFVYAADLERILAAAPVVYGAERVRGEMNREWLVPLTERNEPIGSTHTARLLCVQPIVRDTAESLLHELIDYNYLPHGNCDSTFHNLVDRARKLLENK